jgi:hypothetical protein
MPTPTTPTFAFVFQVETVYDVTEIVVRICYETPSGELRNPQPGFSNVGYQYADFPVTAYLDRHHVTPWGFTHAFAPYRTVLEQAESMVKVLRKIRKGLHQASTERGTLTDAQFGEYVFRIAAILGIHTYHVRGTKKQTATSGKVFTRTDGAGVQQWITDQVTEIQPCTG